MLFNSPEFLFAFLPLTLLLTGVALFLRGRSAGIATLTVASLFFYGWWEVQALLVIGTSIAFNYTLAQSIAISADDAKRRKKVAVGVAVNLAALAYFKYANFFIANVVALTGANLHAVNVVLPLAISFYTFQQIAFLVDTYKGNMERIPFRNYMISVVFFPHLIAGPLLHYRDIISQFEQRFRVTWTTVGAGLPIFAMGLAKKVGLADPIAQFVSPLFVKAQSGPLELFEAWAAALGYTAQLYFDFSGYSDMAIGLGLMFGITLPLNFFSPYKATSIIEFWRRWHMTLSSFLRDYLYFSLGGGQVGPVRRNVNLMIVMLLGGLWHGAAWTFVFWGALHGAFLIINHLWRNLVGSRLRRANAALVPLYGALTFLLVVISWVFFRAASFEVALNVLTGMFAPAVVSLPGEFAYHLDTESLPGIVWGQGMSFADFAGFWAYAAAAYAIIWLAPNSAQIFSLDGSSTPKPKLSVGALMVARVAAMAILCWICGFGVFSAVPSEFLYFQF
jgi:alginate O-acetyltransferase complex protein AlgI